MLSSIIMMHMPRSSFPRRPARPLICAWQQTLIRHSQVMQQQSPRQRRAKPCERSRVLQAFPIGQAAMPDLLLDWPTVQEHLAQRAQQRNRSIRVTAHCRVQTPLNPDAS